MQKPGGESWGRAVGDMSRGDAAARAGSSQTRVGAGAGGSGAPGITCLSVLGGCWLASCHYRNEHSRQLQYQRTTPQDPWRPRRFFFLSPSGPSVSSTGRSSRVYCMILSADTDTFLLGKQDCVFIKKIARVYGKHQENEIKAITHKLLAID